MPEQAFYMVADIEEAVAPHEGADHQEGQRQNHHKEKPGDEGSDRNIAPFAELHAQRRIA